MTGQDWIELATWLWFLAVVGIVAAWAFYPLFEAFDRVTLEPPRDNVIDMTPRSRNGGP